MPCSRNPLNILNRFSTLSLEQFRKPASTNNLLRSMCKQPSQCSSFSNLLHKLWVLNNKSFTLIK